MGRIWVMYEPDTFPKSWSLKWSLHFIDHHLVLTSCVYWEALCRASPVQGSSALGMILWNQIVGVLLESACSGSLVASVWGGSNLNHYVWTSILH